jgi:hypothetical protein
VWLHSCLCLNTVAGRKMNTETFIYGRDVSALNCVVMKRSNTRKYTVMCGRGIVITLTRYCDKPTGTMVL